MDSIRFSLASLVTPGIKAIVVSPQDAFYKRLSALKYGPYFQHIQYQSIQFDTPLINDYSIPSKLREYNGNKVSQVQY